MNLSCLKTQIHFNHNKLEEIRLIIQSFYHEKEIYIITDKNVFNLYSEKIKEVLEGYTLYFCVLKPGEKAKSFKSYEKVVNKLIENNITRKHLILALGGGVVGDLAGFIASTILRGIDYIQIPTTLLAQVDSSIGGKTGINLKQGKNLVGTFYPPKHTIIDTIFLETLKEENYQEGIVEMIKIGLLKDNDLLTYIRENEKVTLTEIHKAVNAKIFFVEDDEFDQNKRQLLNFGHTFGHAIEKQSKYKISHGKAVAYGMLIALKIGKSPIAMYDDLEKMLISKRIFNAPYSNYKELEKYLNFDKKRTPKGLQFVVLEDYQKPKQIWLKDLMKWNWV